MRKLAARMLVAAVIATLLAGAMTVVSSTNAFAGKPPKPPNCPNCQPTIQVGGKTCTLVSCGSDCVYQCPFP